MIKILDEFTVPYGPLSYFDSDTVPSRRPLWHSLTLSDLKNVTLELVDGASNSPLHCIDAVTAKVTLLVRRRSLQTML
jgi:hypothetical protein